MPKPKCCVCKSSTSKRFTDTQKFNKGCLVKCFGLQEEREGVLCDACRRLVCKHKQDSNLTFPLVVDSKGKCGKSDLKQAIAQRARHRLSPKNDSCTAKRPTTESLETFTQLGPHGNFLDLPKDILLRVLSFLAPRELLSFHAGLRFHV